MTAVDDLHSATAPEVAGGAGRRALTRAELVDNAAAGWRDELVSLAGRDPLLSYRDLKVGTLDLAAAEPEARKALLDGEPVYVSKLFPHEPLRSSALRSARAIRDTARELWLERGITACALAVGIATWANPFAAHRPSAPVLLRTATVTARDPAETDYVIEVAVDAVVNPVLLRALDTQLGLRFSHDDLCDTSGSLRYPVLVERLHEFAPAHVVDGFSIAHRAVFSTFSAEPSRLADDIAALGSDLEQNDVIAALAGDDDARASAAAVPHETSHEFVAFDLDDDQTAAVAAVASGANVAIDAPPGSGRTQTVAAIAAELVGRGERVLVVNPKRAAVDDLVDRMSRAGLDDLLVDIGAATPRQNVARVARLSSTLAHIGATPSGAADDAADVDDLRRRIDEYRYAVHRTRSPWGTTAYEAAAAVASTPPDARTPVRADPRLLTGAGGLHTIRSWAREYVGLGGLALTDDGSPWHGSDVTTEVEAAEVLAAATHLRKNGAPALRDAAVRSAVEVGLAGPTTLVECLETADLLAAVAVTIDRFGDGIWAEPLDDLIFATGSRRYRRENPVPSSGGGSGARRKESLSYLARRSMRRQADALPNRRVQRPTIHQWLRDARDQLAGWQARSRGTRRPRIGPHLAGAVEAAAVVRVELDTLAAYNQRAADIVGLDYAAVGRRLASLVDDQHRLRALPRLRELEEKIAGAGFADLIDELRGTEPSAERLDALVSHVWHASLLDQWRDDDDVLRTFDPAAHESLIEDFLTSDHDAVATGAARVHAARAAAFAQASTEFEGQAAVVAEMGDGSRIGSPRALLETAPDLALAAAPCWVMSPYDVPAQLPPRRRFDVVIVDGAGRLPVAHAVPALARGARVVVVHDDDAALGPLTVTAEQRSDSRDNDPPWNDAPTVMLAAAVSGVLPRAGLGGQYRVRDEKLARFTASTTYAGRSSTLPSAWEPGRLRLDLVTSDGEDGPVDSSDAEIVRVVDLILEHLRTRPHESLGVVTVSGNHARRLDDALRRTLVRSPDVARLLDDTRSESFFIKNAEHVCGDVRDAVIVSLGYGRSVDGRILYRFGALGRLGGDRLLATVATRARERLTVVSTFGADDLSERRLTTPGAQALRQFLMFVESPERFAVEPGTRADPLAEALAERLRDAGADVEIGLGGVCVAARHPKRADRFVLAVETDGPDYIARESVREADRLRHALLRDLGWSVHRVWSMAWLHDPDREAQRLVSAYERAVADADAFDWAVAAAEADVIAGIPDELTASDTDGDDGADDESAADKTDGESTDEADAAVAAEPPDSQRLAPRPDVPADREIADLGIRRLAALARWVESDGRSRSEDAMIRALAAELGHDISDVAYLEPRAGDLLRHAVRVARAGAPPRFL